MADEKVTADEIAKSLEGEAKQKSTEAIKKINGESPVVSKNPNKAQMQLTEEQKTNLSMILDLPLKLTVELGRARVLIQDILQYGQGSVVELNKKAGDPLEITVNNQLIAKGDVVVVNEKFAVRILEIVDHATRIKKMAAGKDSTQILSPEETKATIVPEAGAPEGAKAPKEGTTT